MCGLFGTIRPHTYSPAIRRAGASATLDLGLYAEERGVNSGGVATVHARRLTAADAVTRDFAEISDGRWRIATALGPFSDRIPGHSRVRRDLQTALVVLGHTRWATQGDRSVASASPMQRGDVLGTHNGAVAVWPNLLSGGTDSAWLFSQLDRARFALRAMTTPVDHRSTHRPPWARRLGMDACVPAGVRVPGPSGPVSAGGGGRPGGGTVVGLQPRVAASGQPDP